MAKSTKKEQRESDARSAKSREELPGLLTLFDDIVALAKRADELIQFAPTPDEARRIEVSMSMVQTLVDILALSHSRVREDMARFSARLDAIEASHVTASRLIGGEGAS